MVETAAAIIMVVLTASLFVALWDMSRQPSRWEAAIAQRSWLRALALLAAVAGAVAVGGLIGGSRDVFAGGLLTAAAIGAVALNWWIYATIFRR